MKRLLSILFIAVLFASCSSDDDNDSAPTIVGSWTLVELNAAIPVDLNNDGTADTNILKELPCFKGNGAFTADGKFLLTISSVKAEEVNGVLVYTCDGSIASSGTYVLNGNQLTTTTDGPEPETTTTTIDLTNEYLKTTMDAGNLGQLKMVFKRD
ncbi:MAG: hypothetical protein WBA61_15215 [Aequorivita sp.]